MVLLARPRRMSVPGPSTFQPEKVRPPPAALPDLYRPCTHSWSLPNPALLKPRRATGVAPPPDVSTQPPDGRSAHPAGPAVDLFTEPAPRPPCPPADRLVRPPATQLAALPARPPDRYGMCGALHPGHTAPRPRRRCEEAQPRGEAAPLAGQCRSVEAHRPAVAQPRLCQAVHRHV